MTTALENALKAAPLAIAIACLASAGSAQAAFPGSNGVVAFDDQPNFSNPQQLAKVNPDGSGEGPLHTSASDDSDPAWSPDGRAVAFVRQSGAPNFFTEVWVVAADGTNPTQVTSGAYDSRPAFSGDGARVVFNRGDDIWVVNADGTDAQLLYAPPSGARAFDPVFSPDNSKIAFTGTDPSGSQTSVWVMNANGTGAAPITPSGGGEWGAEPDFSPNGQRIIFSRCVGISGPCFSGWFIAGISVAGGPVTDLTSPPTDFEDVSPVFSPDGTRVAFERRWIESQTQPAFQNRIHVIGSDGTGEQAVSSSIRSTTPDWQPVFPAPGGSGDAGGTAGFQASRKTCRGAAVTIRTTNGDDVIKGTRGRDVVHGQRGDDVLKGFKGNDRLCGGRGEDRLLGGPGDDVLFGGHHTDFLSGGTGRDLLYGGTPGAPVQLFPDSCSGGDGEDGFQNCQKAEGVENALGG